MIIKIIFFKTFFPSAVYAVFRFIFDYRFRGPFDRFRNYAGKTILIKKKENAFVIVVKRLYN